MPLAGLTAADVTTLTGRYIRLFDRLRQLDLASASQRRQAAARMRDICGWMWDRIAAPVLDELGLQPRDRDWPRIWWCPTGSLALLPVHAACRYDPGRGRDIGVADRVMSSYTATVRVLSASRDRARPQAGGTALIVAVAESPGQLPLTHVEQEVAAITAAMSPYPLVLRDHAASRAAVSGALHSHPWFHFAGHSFQDLSNPGQARLCLHDGDLTALAIAGLRLSGAELAYLSSCEGAIAGTSIPDEALHLALAFQIAGYRNVIAALWSIGDADAADVAAGIYGRLASRGQGEDGAAGRALHEVIREMRTRHPPEVWAAYLHAGV